VNTELFNELVQALSEDFSLEELQDLPEMVKTLACLLGSKPHVAPSEP